MTAVETLEKHVSELIALRKRCEDDTALAKRLDNRIDYSIDCLEKQLDHEDSLP